MSERVPGAPGAWSTLATLAAALLGGAGCGGGLPLLHPAQALPQGEVRAAGGFSGNIALGGLSSAVAEARSESARQGGAVSADATYAAGALVLASVAPGLAPFVSARVGLGADFEGGLAYTGRGVRVDARRAFDLDPHWTLSAGLGGSAALYGHQEGSELAGVDLGSLHGWGADVPVLLGYASDGGLYMVWIGARGGWEHAEIGALSSTGTSSNAGGATANEPITLSATRFWGGGVLGMAIGFRHIHVALELDASYAHVAGDFAGAHADVGGATLAPAAALWWHF